MIDRIDHVEDDYCECHECDEIRREEDERERIGVIRDKVEECRAGTFWQPFVDEEVLVVMLEDARAWQSGAVEVHALILAGEWGGEVAGSIMLLIEDDFEFLEPWEP